MAVPQHPAAQHPAPQHPAAQHPAPQHPAAQHPAGADSRSARDREVLLRFVERFAMALADAGMQRMPARVFAYVLADDAERYTAAELASALRVSPAAISGAVRVLVQAGLLGKERQPGTRVDTYRVYDGNLWHTILRQRERLTRPLEQLAAEGAELLGPDTPGGRRMRETGEFYAFLRHKMSDLLEEWQEQQRRPQPSHQR